MGKQELTTGDSNSINLSNWGTALQRLTITVDLKGEDVIGKFNNEGKSEIDLIKNKAIELVDLINEHGKCNRRKSEAITDIEKGVMMAVKSLFV